MSSITPLNELTIHITKVLYDQSNDKKSLLWMGDQCYEVHLYQGKQNLPLEGNEIAKTLKHIENILMSHSKEIASWVTDQEITISGWGLNLSPAAVVLSLDDSDFEEFAAVQKIVDVYRHISTSQDKEQEPPDPDDISDFFNYWDTADESLSFLARSGICLSSKEARQQRRIEKQDLLLASQWIKKYAWTKGFVDFDSGQLHKLTAHILGDTFIRSSGLEGSSTVFILSFIEQYLSHFVDDPSLAVKRQLILEAIAFAKKLTINPTVAQNQELARALQGVLSKLKPGEHYLLVGGWIGEPFGHAIYYEVIREEETFAIKIFNTGAGLEYHPQKYSSSGLLYNPCLKIENIAIKNVLNIVFLQALLELKQNITYKESEGGDRPTLYQAKDLYERILAALEGDVVKDFKTLSFPQADGICAYSGLMAYLLDGLSEEHKTRYLHDLELQVLMNFYLRYEYKPVLGGNQEARLLLQYALEKFARRFLERQARCLNLFDLEEKQKVASILCLINNHVQQAWRVHLYKFQHDLEAISFGPMSTHSFEEPIIIEVPMLGDTADSLKGILSPSLMPLLNKWAFSIDCIECDLKEFYAQCTMHIEDGGKSEEMVYFINELFCQLPLPTKNESLWTPLQVDPKRLLACMEVIGDFGSLLQRAPIIGAGMHYESIIMLNKMTVLLFHLASMAEHTAFLNNCYLPLGPFLKMTGKKLDPQLSFYDSSVEQFEKGDSTIYCAHYRQQYHSICNYIEENKNKESIFNLSNSEFNKGYEVYIPKDFDFIAIKNVEIKFIYDYLSTKDPLFLPDSYANKIKKIAAALQDEGEILPKEFYLFKKQAILSHQWNFQHSYRDPSKPLLKAYINNYGDVRIYEDQNWIFNNSRIYYKNYIWAFDSDNSLFVECHLNRFKGFNTGCVSGKYDDREKAFALLKQQGPNSEFIYPAHLQIIWCLGYFETHWRQLNDFEMQKGCRRLLLQHNYLEKILVEDPEIAFKIVQFINNIYFNCSQENQIHGAVFSVQIKQLMTDSLNYFLTDSNSSILKEAIEILDEEDNLELLKDLLKKTKVEEEVYLIHRQIVCSFASKKQPLSEEEIQLLILSKLIYQNYTNHDLYDNYSELQNKRTSLKFANDIQNYLQSVPLVTDIIEKFFLFMIPYEISEIQKTIWTLDGDSLQGTIDGKVNFSLSLSDFIFRSSRGTLTKINQSMKNQLSNVCQCLPDLARRLSSDILSFKDKDNHEFLVDKEAILRQFGDTKWYRKTYYDFLPECLQPNILSQDEDTVNYWAAEDGLSMLIENNFKVVYQLDFKNEKSEEEEKENDHNVDKHERDVRLLSVSKVDEPSLLFLNNFYLDKNSPYHAFANFEQLPAIHVWHDISGNLQKIDFKILGMSFVRHQNSEALIKDLREKLYCVQESGYVIGEQSFIKQFGLYHRFLILENAQDRHQRKLIIPKAWVLPAQASALSLDTQLDLQEKRMPTYGYFAYELTPEGQILPKSHEESVFLSHIFFLCKNYELALYHLRHASKLPSRQEDLFVDQISQESKSYLESIVLKSPFVEMPKAFSYYLCAQVLLAQCAVNEVGEGEDPFKFILSDLADQEATKKRQEIKNLCDRYFKMGEHMSSCRLTEAEEQVILKYFYCDNAELLEEGKSLDNKYRLDDFNNLIEHRWGDKYDANSIITRGGVISFKEGLNLALTLPPEEREMFKMYLAINDPKKIIDRKNSSIKKVYDFLKTVCEYPDKFSEVIYGGETIKDLAPKLFSVYDSIIKQIGAKNISFDGKIDKQIDPFVASLIPKRRQTSLLNPIHRLYVYQPKRLSRVQGEISKTFTDFFNADSPVSTLSMQEKDAFIDALSTVKDIRLVNLSKEIVDDYEKTTISYTFNFESKKELNKNLSKINQLLLIESAELGKQARKFHEQILSIINKHSIEPDIDILQQLSFIGTSIKPATIDELSIFLLQDNIQGLQASCPNLTAHDLNSLQTLLAEYYVQATEQQAVERLLEKQREIEDYIKPFIDEESLRNDVYFIQMTQSFALEMLAKRSYNPQDHLEYLLFEYHADIRLREDQIEKLALLTNPQRPEIAMQMIMGAGKTKVLLPILAMKKADGHRLSMVIVPEALYASVAQDMLVSADHIFHQSLKFLEVNRTPQLNKEQLDQLLEALQQTISQRKCLIVTSKTLQCLSLQFQEMLLREVIDLKQLCVMARILALLKDKGDAVVDEIHSILNCRHEVQFTLGSAESLTKDRYAVVRTIYECMAENPKLFPLDFLPIIDKDIFCFEKDLYFEKVLPRFVVLLINKLKEKDDHLAYFLQNLEPADNDLLAAYFLDKQIGADAFVKEIGNAEIRHSLALIKEELNVFLILTLSKRCFVHYGPSHNKEIVPAIPYRGNNTPDESSRFGNPYETLNYTLQMYCLTGIPSHLVKKQVLIIKEELAKELNENPALKTCETITYQTFTSLFKNRPDVDLQYILKILKETTDEDIQWLTDAINAKKHGVFFDFLENYILPTVQIHTQKISSNPLDLVDMLNVVQGFSGTPWNYDTYHNRIKIEPSHGVDGKTLSLLYKHSHAITILPEAHGLDILDSIVTQETLDDGLRAHIDLGSLFAGISNIDVAYKIFSLLQPPLKGVVFYNLNKLVVLEKKDDRFVTVAFRESSLSPEERFTYYDQRHTIGADIKQPVMGKATVSIGKESMISDLLQAVWRMRGLAHGQSVKLCLTKETASLLKDILELPVDEEMTLPQIIQFVALNEAEQLEAHNIASVKQKIKHSLKQAVIDALIKKLVDGESSLKEIDEELPDLLEGLKMILTDSQQDLPFDNYGKQQVMEDTALVIGAYTEKMKTCFQAIPKNLFDGEIKDIQESIDFSKLPAFLPWQELNIEDGKESQVEIEVQQEKELRNERELEMEINHHDLLIPRCKWSLPNGVVGLTHCSYYRGVSLQDLKQSEDNSPKLFSLAEALRASPNESIASFADIFDENLLATFNYLPIKPLINREGCMKLFSKSQSLVHSHLPDYSLIVKNLASQTFKVVMLDRNGDVGFLFKALTEIRSMAGLKKLGAELYLYVSTLGVIQHTQNSDRPLNEHDILDDDHVVWLLMQAKLYRGRLNFTAKELSAFELLAADKGIARLRELLDTYILPNNPSLKARFERLPLYKIMKILR